MNCICNVLALTWWSFNCIAVFCVGILCDVRRCSMGQIVMFSGYKGISIFMLLISSILQRSAVIFVLCWISVR